MSWLLAALFPGVLMLATFGLERIESALARTDSPAGDPTRFHTPTKSDESDRTARNRSHDAFDGLEGRLHHRHLTVGALADDVDSGRLPTRLYAQHLTNPGFQPTRHANRV